MRRASPVRTALHGTRRGEVVRQGEVVDEPAERQEPHDDDATRVARGAQRVRRVAPLPEPFAHHRVEPDLAVRGDDLDDSLEVVAVEALGREELADLPALALGHGLDVALLLAPRQLALLGLGSEPRQLRAAMLNPSATSFAAPRTITMLALRSAPSSPATTANVVTAPSIAPWTKSRR
jgi:hypothetical protein